MSSFKRSRAKHVKKPHPVSNWRAYETGLRNRGSLTVWLGLEPGQTTVPSWDPPADRKLKRGGQQLYSDHAIATATSASSARRCGLEGWPPRESKRASDANSSIGCQRLGCPMAA